MSLFHNNMLMSPSGAAAFDTTLIGNSVWLDGSADFFKRDDWAISADGRKEFIFSMWIQRNEFGRAQTHFDLIPTGHTSYNDGTHFIFAADDQLGFSVANGGSSGGEKITSAMYRDIGWYHVLISYNTNTAIAATSRHRLFVNGLEISDTSAYTAPSDNQSCLGSGTGNADLRIGRTDHSGIPYPPNSYFTQACYLEGKSFQAGDFAITDFLDSFTFGTNGSQFGPKADADIAALASTVGGNSFCLDFANSGDLGNDISSNNKDLTPDSMAAANQSINTPSVAYPKISNIGTPSGDAAASYTMGLGSNRMVYSGGNQTYKGLISTQLIKPDDSPIYWEYYLESGSVGGASGGRTSVGLCVPHFNVGNGNGFAGAGGNNPSNLRGVIYDNGSQGSTTADTLVPVGGIQNLAYEPSTGKIWFGVDGTWNNGSESASTTLNPSGHDYQATAQDYVFFIAAARSSDIGVINFGDNPSFSGNETAGTNADGNGHGLFAYAVPSGFFAPNSANLTAQEIQGVDGFITTLATEANIVSDVATARSDWSTAYVDILKNRSSIEAWIYRFGDDSSNEFIGDGSEDDFSTYQSTSSLSGSDNWLGYSIRIGADYLTAAGSASHTNGAATTVTHSLGTSRYCVLLFERGSSKSVWFHHPDFASGSLLEFFKDEALASSTQITTIGANSFQIGSGAATATHSYLVFADGGIASMGKHVGNGVVNGPYIPMSHSSGFFARRSGGARSFWKNNSKVPGYNENGDYARFNDPQAEGTGSLKIDMLAGGIKIRDAYADQNTSGETFYWVSFGELSGGGESLPPVYGR